MSAPEVQVRVWSERGGYRYECTRCGARPYLFWFTEADARANANRHLADELERAIGGGE